MKPNLLVPTQALPWPQSACLRSQNLHEGAMWLGWPSLPALSSLLPLFLLFSGLSSSASPHIFLQDPSQTFHTLSLGDLNCCHGSDTLWTPDLYFSQELQTSLCNFLADNFDEMFCGHLKFSIPQTELSLFHTNPPLLLCSIFQ